MMCLCALGSWGTVWAGAEVFVCVRFMRYDVCGVMMRL